MRSVNNPHIHPKGKAAFFSSLGTGVVKEPSWETGWQSREGQGARSWREAGGGGDDSQSKEGAFKANSTSGKPKQ